jgi:hypothetical protein
MIVKDRIALDLKQIELVIRIELLQALERCCRRSTPCCARFNPTPMFECKKQKNEGVAA